MLAGGGGAAAYFLKRSSATSWKLKWALEGHTDSIQGLAFALYGNIQSDNSFGALLGSCGLDKTIRFWDVNAGKPWGQVPLPLSEG